MTFWAASGRFANTAFLCVCVDPDGLGTAKEFSKLYFGSAPGTLVNGYIDSQKDFPDFQAQLGCQGFTIFDGSHKMVVNKTLPWVQYRDDAFRDLEGKLMRIIQPNFENPLGAPIGQSVRIVNLTSDAGKHLNGQVGEVAGSLENGRFVVKLPDGAKSFLPENLEDATGAPIGARMRVAGLTSEKGAELNGQIGNVLGGTSSGRYLVKLPGGTMALRVENLQTVSASEEDAELLKALPSVDHQDMDSQHETCLDALRLLLSKLSVQSLRRVRDELKHHFDEEEALMREAGFGAREPQEASCCGGGCEEKKKAPDYSAQGSHIKDHNRIVALAEDALASLTGACESGEGSVPRNVAVAICRGFADHATLYDALYAGKL